MEIIEALQEAEKGNLVTRPDWYVALTHSEHFGFYWVDIETGRENCNDLDLSRQDCNATDWFVVPKN